MSKSTVYIVQVPQRLDRETGKWVDEKIINALRNKLDVSRLVTGDNYKEWI